MADPFLDALTHLVDAVPGVTGAAFTDLDGEEIAVHEVMLAMTKADTSFRLMTTVGRKAIEAYQEIMRLQV